MINYQAISREMTKTEIKELYALYKKAGWWEGTAVQAMKIIPRIIGGSFRFVIALDDGKIIGMGRSISDGISDAYIQDVTVLPEYRRRGIGGGIIEKLVSELQAAGIGWIGLISEPGHQSFYRKLHFSEMEGYTPFILKTD